MVAKTFYAIDSEAFSVAFSTTQNVGDSIINNSDSPDGTRYIFESGYGSGQVTISDTGGSSSTLEDDDRSNHVVTNGGGLVDNGNGIEAESLIYLREIDEFGNPSGSIITVTVFSQNGVTADVWGFASDTPLQIGTEYVKVGGSNIGTGDYIDYQISGDGVVDGTEYDDLIGAGYADRQNDMVDSSDGINDVIIGGAGSDTINGNAGNDTIYGDSEHDSGHTPPAGTETYNDVINGGVGDDYIDGGYGRDNIQGGTGADTLIGGQGVDTIDGGDGADMIFGDFDDNLDTYNRSGDVGGTKLKLTDTLYDGNGKVTVSLKDYSGGDKNVAAVVQFQDDKAGSAPLKQLEIKGIGRKGVGIDEDVMYFDMSRFDDDFLIKLGSEGAEDKLIFENVISSKMVNDQTVISYLGRDGATHTVTVEKTVAQIEIITGSTPADFASDGDIITGGAGNDTIDGGFGNDSISGGADNDTFYASSGNDTVDGGTGADTYRADWGSTITDETIEVNVNSAGNGTVHKVNDNSTDTVTSIEYYIAGEAAGEADSITISDNIGVVSLGGLNNTSVGTLTSNSGNVIAFGGAGEPTINELLSGTYVHPTFGPVQPKGTYQISSGEEDGAQLGNINVQNFENIAFSVVCFARGTHIDTDRGEILIEDLCKGDLVRTLDHGLQPIRWIGATVVPGTGRLAPVEIRKGALGNHRDLRVSPQHRMMLQGWQQELLFGELETLATAKSLINDSTIRRVRSETVEYHHMLFDTHEIVFAEGAPSESFHPGHVGMGSFSEETREEILELFPELRTDFGAYGPSARISLRDFEARLLASDAGGMLR